VLAAAYYGRLIDRPDLLSFDMGGTTAKACLIENGQPALTNRIEAARTQRFMRGSGLPIAAPALELIEIGAGGGSIAYRDDLGLLKVGPESAAADPGPACYGRGGTQPTMSDLCVLAGLIDPNGFAGGKMKLDADLARKSFENLDTPLSFEHRVRYAYDIGLNNIAEGIFNIAVKNGIDPRDYSLVAYGAAGPLLLPAIADLIHVKRVIVPPHPGLFSALGLLSADQVYSISQSAYRVLTTDSVEHIGKVFEAMEEKLRKRLGPGKDVEFVRAFDGQLVGQTWETPFVAVPGGPFTVETIQTMIRNFHDAYFERNGNRFESIPVQGVTYRVRAVVHTDKVAYKPLAERSGAPLKSIGTSVLRYLSDAEQLAQIYARDDLRAGDEIAGPAIVREALSTTYITQNQIARVGRFGELRIERKA
jgi:N-methylhydantoinase A